MNSEQKLKALLEQYAEDESPLGDAVLPIARQADADLAALREQLDAAEKEVEMYHVAVEYAKEHLDTTIKNFIDSLVDGRTERCPACGCPTLKKSLVACCEFHGSVCEDCWGDCEHIERTTP